MRTKQRMSKHSGFVPLRSAVACINPSPLAAATAGNGTNENDEVLVSPSPAFDTEDRATVEVVNAAPSGYTDSSTWMI